MEGGGVLAPWSWSPGPRLRSVHGGDRSEVVVEFIEAHPEFLDRMSDHPEDQGREVGVEQGDEATANAVVVEVLDVDASRPMRSGGKWDRNLLDLPLSGFFGIFYDLKWKSPIPR